MVDRVELDTTAAAAAGDQDSKPEPTPQPSPETAPARPEWLPEKFADPQALVDSYSELERKLSAGDAEESTESAPPLTTETFQQFSEKFHAEGLTEADYSELERLGVSRELVAQIAAGSVALQDRAEAAVYAEVGGRETYDNMLRWASSALSESEAATYNADVNSSDPARVMNAAKGLHARFVASEGSEASLVQGATATSGEGVYESAAQVAQAMKDPRYERDPAYRAEVHRKLGNSRAI